MVFARQRRLCAVIRFFYFRFDVTAELLKQTDKQNIYEEKKKKKRYIRKQDRNLLFWRVYTTLLVGVEGIRVFDWTSTFAVRLRAQSMVIIANTFLFRCSFISRRYHNSQSILIINILAGESAVLLRASSIIFPSNIRFWHVSKSQNPINTFPLNIYSSWSTLSGHLFVRGVQNF